jgi:hypothetical protein
MKTSAVLVLAALAQLISLALSFRIVNITDVDDLSMYPPAVFTPYEKGNVGYYGDPMTTFFREHINPGVIFNPEQPMQWNGDSISRMSILYFHMRLLTHDYQSDALVWSDRSAMVSIIASEKNTAIAIRDRVFAGVTWDIKD